MTAEFSLTQATIRLEIQTVPAVDPLGDADAHCGAMERHLLRSQSIASAGYDAARSTLEVEFRDGSRYVYYMVPRSIFEGLVAAESAGNYLVQHVRGQFRDQRIDN